MDEVVNKVVTGKICPLDFARAASFTILHRWARGNGE